VAVVTLDALKKAARRWVPYWRDRLGLRDWHIDIEYLENLEALAECCPLYSYRRARVALAANMRRWDGEDVERTIVHELLHIHLGALGVGLGRGYDPQKMSKLVLCEQVINALAQCLVDRRRGRP
jgi:hypothetical protein